MVKEMVEIKSRLFSIMEDILQVDRSALGVNSAPGVIKEWDSLKHMLLMMALEEEFEFRFTDDEMTKCVNVKNILQILDGK